MYSGSFPIPINLWLILCLLRQTAALGAGIALDAQLGVELVDILLDAALGEIELFGDLPVGEPLGNQGGDLPLPVSRAKAAGAAIRLRRASAASPSAMICAVKSLIPVSSGLR